MRLTLTLGRLASERSSMTSETMAIFSSLFIGIKKPGPELPGSVVSIRFSVSRLGEGLLTSHVLLHADGLVGYGPGFLKFLAVACPGWHRSQRVAGFQS